MKMKMFTMLCALSLSATATFAQKGVEDGSRFGHGEDSLRCLQNISIYSEYVKTDNLLTHTNRGWPYSRKPLWLRLVLIQMEPRFYAH